MGGGQMNEIIIAILVVIGLTLFAYQASNIVALYFGAPFIRTPKRAIKDILDLVDIKSTDKFFELGSGWGEVLSYVNKKYKIQAYGVEVSIVHYFISALLNFTNRNVKIRLADFNEFSLEKADIVYCNLTSKLTKKLEKKFHNELKKGSHLISFKFPLPNTDHKFTYHAGKEKIFYYEF
jgi:cyclopropane fatty-acyl-phospholipid synthase-like methyltransferase